MSRRGPSTRVIDLNGRFALPGFNDAHVHVDATGSLLIGANLLDVHTSKPFKQRIAEAAGRLPKGSWILRGDWGRTSSGTQVPQVPRFRRFPRFPRFHWFHWFPSPPRAISGITKGFGDDWLKFIGYKSDDMRWMEGSKRPSRRTRKRPLGRPSRRIGRGC